MSARKDDGSLSACQSTPQTCPCCNANAACAALKPPLIKILVPVTAKLKRFAISTHYSLPSREWWEIMCACLRVCIRMPVTSIIYMGCLGYCKSQQTAAISHSSRHRFYTSMLASIVSRMGCIRSPHHPGHILCPDMRTVRTGEGKRGRGCNDT